MRRYFHLAFFFIALISCLLITFRVVTVETPFLDVWASPIVANLDDSYLFIVFRWVTELGSWTFITPFTIVMTLFIWWYYKDWFGAITIATGTLLGYQVNYWIKDMVQRERPRILEEAEGIGYSFPSGHAMGAIIAYGLFIYFFSKHVKSNQGVLWINIIGVLLIVLIGFSRYIIRVHYLTDVLGGYMFGYLFLIFWIALYNLIDRIILASRSQD